MGLEPLLWALQLPVAQALAVGLGAIEGVVVVFPPRPTNILKVDFADVGWLAAEVVGRWKERGVLCNPRPPHGARLVVNRHVGLGDVEYVVEVTREMLERGETLQEPVH